MMRAHAARLMSFWAMSARFWTNAARRAPRAHGMAGVVVFDVSITALMNFVLRMCRPFFCAVPLVALLKTRIRRGMWHEMG